VFLLLSPIDGAANHLQMLARAGRAMQDRELRRLLRVAKTPQDAYNALSTWQSGVGS